MEVYRETMSNTTNREEPKRMLLEETQRRYDARFIAAFGPAAGIMASQLLFLDGRGHDPDGWVYKSQEEWQAETGLNRNQLRQARKRLKAAGVLYEERRGVPYRNYYRLDLWALLEAVALKSEEAAGEESRCTLYSNSGTPGSPASGAPARPASETPGSPAISKSTSKTYSVGGSDEPQEGSPTKNDVTRFTSLLRDYGSLSPDSQERNNVAANLKRIRQKDHATEDEVKRVILRMASRWTDGYRLSPQQALADVRGKPCHQQGDGPPQSTGTPEAGIRAMEKHEHRYGHKDLVGLIPIARAYDFTCEEAPPFWVLKRISRDEVEAADLAERMQKVARRAVKEANESAPSEPGEAAQPEDDAPPEQPTPSTDEGLIDVYEMIRRDFPEVAARRKRKGAA